MIEVWGTISAIIAISGVVMNNKRMIGCFWLWIFSNAVSAAIHMYCGVWSMAVRDVIFLVLAIHGLICWKRAGVSRV